MMKKILLFSFLLVLQKTVACSCLTQPGLTKESAEKLEGAYYGKIISIQDDSTHFKTYKLLVSETYRGEVRDTLTFDGASDVGMCGFQTEVGAEWLITFDSKEEHLYLSICSRAYDFSNLIDRRKHYKFRFRYHENRYARKELHRAEHDLQVLRKLE
jgi:hypothetical protein